MPQPSKVIHGTTRDFLEDRAPPEESTYQTGKGPGPGVKVPPDKRDDVPVSPMERMADALERIANYLERTDPLASLMVEPETDEYGLAAGPGAAVGPMDPGMGDHP